ncbi:MAG: hypothetical protein ACK4YF_00460 [Exilispira sp.]
MDNLFSLPLRLDFITSLVILFFSVFGLIFYKYKKDKIFLLFIALLQIVILGVIFNIIKHFPNILTISSLISFILIIIFLMFKTDKIFTYISFLIHFTSLFQLLYIINFIK